MDSLAGYGSSDDDEPHHVLPPVLYLENYAMNQRNLVSCFPYVPWNPSPAILQNLRQCYKGALAQIEKDMPEMNSRYLWGFSGQPQQSHPSSRFALSNVKSITGLHVTLLPNVMIKKHRYDQYLRNLMQAVRSVPIPPLLVMEVPPSKLDIMLGTAPKKCLSLRVNPTLRTFMSSRTGAVFVSVGICDLIEKERLPEFQYLRALTKVCWEQAELLDGKYPNIEPFLKQEKLPDGLPWFNFHVTIAVGEPRMFEHRLTPEEFDHLRLVVQEAEVLQFAQALTIDLDTFILNGGDKIATTSLV